MLSSHKPLQLHKRVVIFTIKNMKIFFSRITHPGGNPGANLETIPYRCQLRGVAFEWDFT